MSGRRLDDSYAAVQMQLGAHDHARQAASRPTVTTELLVRLGLPDSIGTITKNRRKTVLEHFERTGRQIRRQCFIDLVSSFEADLFHLLGISGIPSFYGIATSLWIALDRCITSAKRCMRGRSLTSGMLGMSS